MSGGGEILQFPSRLHGRVRSSLSAASVAAEVPHIRPQHGTVVSQTASHLRSVSSDPAPLVGIEPAGDSSLSVGRRQMPSWFVSELRRCGRADIPGGLARKGFETRWPRRSLEWRHVNDAANGGRARRTSGTGRAAWEAEGVSPERRAFARESVSRETAWGEVGSWTAGVVAPGLAAFSNCRRENESRRFSVSRETS